MPRCAVLCERIRAKLMMVTVSYEKSVCKKSPEMRYPPQLLVEIYYVSINHLTRTSGKMIWICATAICHGVRMITTGPGIKRR